MQGIGILMLQSPEVGDVVKECHACGEEALNQMLPHLCASKCGQGAHGGAMTAPVAN